MRITDLKMTWACTLPILLAGYADGSPTGRAVAVEEFKRMAETADHANELAKALKMVLTVFERSSLTAGQWMEVQHAKELLGRLPVQQLAELG
ncbi:hypothetical protein BRCH_02058c [Candidatus Burkholderia brachyanthoides]|nr:hypothetical protein BRCH_02058c [Candidatus Burkholderia brachyanthoides]